MLLFPPPLPAGRPLPSAAFLQAAFTSSVVITAELPVDDTVPLVTEGTEILTLTATPLSAASRFLIHIEVWGGYKDTQNITGTGTVSAEAQTRAWAAALFRGSTCLQAACGADTADVQAALCLRMALLDQPATASPITWSVRAGPSRLVTTGSPTDPGLGFRVNGEYFRSAGTFVTEQNHRMHGGAAKCTLIVQEIP